MKAAAALSALTMAVAAIAAPSEIEARGGVCNSNGRKQVCCTGLLNCLVQVFGSGCDGSTFCCNTKSAPGTLVNVALLQCVAL